VGATGCSLSILGKTKDQPKTNVCVHMPIVYGTFPTIFQSLYASDIINFLSKRLSPVIMVKLRLGKGL